MERYKLIACFAGIGKFLLVNICQSVQKGDKMINNQKKNIEKSRAVAYSTINGRTSSKLSHYQFLSSKIILV